MSVPTGTLVHFKGTPGVARTGHRAGQLHVCNKHTILGRQGALAVRTGVSFTVDIDNMTGNFIIARKHIAGITKVFTTETLLSLSSRGRATGWEGEV